VQSVCPDEVHVPPAHVSVLITVVAPEHDAAWQTVPLGHVAQAPEPLQRPPSSTHVAAADEVHTPRGSGTPEATGWHNPSTPLGCPVFAFVHASHEPPHAELQHTPSVHVRPPAQSAVMLHFLPCAQRFVHVATFPPQSTSVSLPSFLVSLHASVPPQPLDGVPQVSPSAAQVVAVQPQVFAVPPPPQVS
jgi:hypothetical protein